jgi:hypothetical protein
MARDVKNKDGVSAICRNKRDSLQCAPLRSIWRGFVSPGDTPEGNETHFRPPGGSPNRRLTDGSG